MPASNAELEADLELVKHLMEGVQHRLTQLEARLPISHAGFGVTTTPGPTETEFIVHLIDRFGIPANVVFTVSNSDLPNS